ncbi:MAG: DUF5659 domain-containing protein [Actinobacteria bacterium]|nr:DUF5659 domain-containing protein [Actinomycetota bacterium]
MKKNKTFNTKDFFLACFLKAKDVRLVKTEKTGNLAHFCFEEDKSLEELITGFYNDRASIFANRFVNAIRDLKALVHNI